MKNDRLARRDSAGSHIVPLPIHEIDKRRQIIATCVFVIVGLLSFFVVGEYASSPEAHGKTIETLDQKKDTVMTLVAGSSGTSTAITVLPGDAGTPIAEKLVDLSSDFLIVIAAIYLEKYLLTILGFLAFKVVIPICCAIMACLVWVRDNDQLRNAIAGFVVKAVLVSIAMFLVVPVSVFVSGMIESTYQSSLDNTLETAEKTAEDIEAAAETQSTEEGSKDKGILETLQSIPESLSEVPGEVGKLVEEAKEALNNFIEALAVMIVTSCLIPLLVLVFFLWLVKSLLGIDVDIPMSMLRPRTFRKK